MSTASSSITIDITKTGFTLNTIDISIPCPLSTLIQILGEARHASLKYSKVFTWDALGIHAYSKDGKTVDCVGICIMMENKYWFSPASRFAGTLTIEGEHHSKLPVIKEDKLDHNFSSRLGNHTLFVTVDEHDTILEIQISEYQPPAPLEDPGRFDFKPITGEKIVFDDFNFKLCVVQILMYQMNVLTPVFDVYQFTERYKLREINVDKEGYRIIPEVKEYFEKLEIDKKYSDLVTSIEQDGGNDIYMNIIPFWSGETDDFNIQVFTDTTKFRKLKHMTLFYDENQEEIRKALALKGIDADTL